MTNILRTSKAKINILLLLIFLLFLSVILSLGIGQNFISFKSVYNAFFNYEQDSTKHLIVRSTRLSRTIIALVSGGSLAVSGLCS